MNPSPEVVCLKLSCVKLVLFTSVTSGASPVGTWFSKIIVTILLFIYDLFGMP